MLKILLTFTDTATQSGAYIPVEFICGLNQFSSEKEALGLIQGWGRQERQ